MPVTTRVATVEVKPAPETSTYTATSLFEKVCPQLWKAARETGTPIVIDSSFSEATPIRAVRHFGAESESANGFVGTLLDAYRLHNHVVLRPEDVWLAILTQFKFYVTSHAEQMRRHFVSHAGKVKLYVELNQLDMAEFAMQMSHLIDEKIKDKDFRAWIMPDFSTTTDTDRVTAAIVMMGTMEKYFSYFCGITCGIPSVTLLGEEQDWQDILRRIDYLSKFTETDGPSLDKEPHAELAKWQSVLRIVVKNMVDTFKAPNSPGVVKFWQRAVHSHEDDYSGEKMISGWVLAFLFWDERGNPLVAQRNVKVASKDPDHWWVDGTPPYSMAWNDVPTSYVHVPIHINNLGDKFMAKGIAGSVGYTTRDSDEVFQMTKKRPGVESQNKSPKTDATLLSRTLEVMTSIGKRIICSSEKQPPTEAVEEKEEPRPVIHHEKQARKVDPYSEVPQFSDLSELNEPWAYADGGKNDTLQPVSGWWVIRTKEGTYGRDPDVPDVQFDDDAADFDHNLAYVGRPLGD